MKTINAYTQRNPYHHQSGWQWYINIRMENIVGQVLLQILVAIETGMHLDKAKETLKETSYVLPMYVST